jgi:integrase
LLALCVRKNELLQARWSEFNLDAKLWRLPLDRSKTSKAYRIPLPEIAVEWLRELKVRAHNSEYVFPARLIQKRKLPHISPDTLNVAVNRVKHGLEHFVVHDLRRTARTHLGRLKVPPHVAELCLNHKLKGITGIYDTNDYFDERREALNKWANEISKIENGNVISIESAKKLRKM